MSLLRRHPSESASPDPRSDYVVLGPRVRIRRFVLDDVDRWQAWPDYPELLHRGSSPRRLSADQRAAWFRDLVDRQRQIPFAIEDEYGAFIGRLFLRQVKADEGSAVLGIDLDPACLGQRYGTEALGVFLDYYFGEMAFQKMLLSVAAYNDRGRRSYASLGFRIIGTHWDLHAGPDPSADPRFDEHRANFRRGPGGLETLFYDMELHRTDWRGYRAFAG